MREKPAGAGVKAPYPGFIEPSLASAVDKVPAGERWIHEIKFDGYRAQIHIVNEPSKSLPAAAMTGPIACARLPMTRGT